MGVRYHRYHRKKREQDCFFIELPDLKIKYQTDQDVVRFAMLIYI
jgi:hypothetical protein